MGPGEKPPALPGSVRGRPRRRYPIRTYGCDWEWKTNHSPLQNPTHLPPLTHTSPNPPSLRPPLRPPVPPRPSGPSAGPRTGIQRPHPWNIDGSTIKYWRTTHQPSGVGSSPGASRTHSHPSAPRGASTDPPPAIQRPSRGATLPRGGDPARPNAPSHPTH